MFSFVWQKMKSNRWKVLSLLFGCILVVGMFASIPIYTEGILQRMLIKQLENRQTEQKIYSGYYGLAKEYRYTTDTSDSKKSRYQGTFQSIDKIRSEMTKVQADIPYKEQATDEMIQLENLFIEVPTSVEGQSEDRSVTIGSMTGIEDHLSLVAGRMYENSSQAGVFEAVVTEKAMQQKGFTVGSEIEIKTDLYGKEPSDVFKVRIVGVVSASDYKDSYWYTPLSTFDDGLIMNYSELFKETQKNWPRNLVNYSLWSTYDFRGFRFQDASSILNATNASAVRLKDIDKKITVNCTFSDIMTNYPSYQTSLQTSLQILFIPIVLMLAFYIYMVSQLMVTTDKTVISVMESRGAGKGRIVLFYLMEYSLLAAVSFILGPLLGLLMCKVLGASNGFLSFVSRTALPVQIGGAALLYAAAAMIFFVLVTLIPVFLFARKGIVETKRTVSRKSKSPVWQRYFFDIILLGISGYALYLIRSSLADETSFVSKNNMLLFLASTLFIMGAGMLFLRIYPLLVKIVYRIGRKKWSPVLYTSFLQVSRTDGREQFLMLFIVLALSVGIFNANAARTINQNKEDEVSQSIGADLVVQETWLKYTEDGSVASSSNPTLSSSTSQATHYNEPSLDRFSSMDGVEHVARVLSVKNNNKLTSASSRAAGISVMGIDPAEFGQVAWSRSDALPAPINSYLNAMTENPGFVVISKKLSDSLKVNPGDSLTFSVDSGEELQVTVLGVVDYWPGLSSTYITEEGVLVYNCFMVMDLDYYLSNNPMIPYEVWIKKTDGTLDQDIYNQIEKKSIAVDSISSMAQSIAAVKNDPQLQGLNGALSLGFIVSMLICAVGFLIYWIVSIQGRVLQFGIYRAMGMKKRSILGIIGAEQVMISGVAIGAGILIGNIASTLYVPLFKILNNNAGTSLPYRIVSQLSDYLKIYVILGIILILCFIILSRLMLSIRIDQAVKLGEE